MSESSDLDRILADLMVHQIPEEYILLGIIRGMNGKQLTVDSDVIKVLFKDQDDIDEDDEEVIQELVALLEDNKAEIDVVVNVEKLKQKITKTVNTLIKNHIRK